jgi:hypothetical protein
MDKEVLDFKDFRYIVSIMQMHSKGCQEQEEHLTKLYNQYLNHSKEVRNNFISSETVRVVNRLNKLISTGDSE